MKLRSALLCIYLVSFGASNVSTAATLTFDEPSIPYGEWQLVPGGYGGLQWNYFGVLNGSLRPPREGYYTGMVSPQNVAFNIQGDPASISSSTAFTLNSAYLTAAFFEGLQLRVEGWTGTTLAYSNTYILSSNAPTLIQFNYVGVDLVKFIPSTHSAWFAMDNLVINDGDADGDGVPDSLDRCPGTAPGVVVNEAGCSIDQIVPCDRPWKNHGQYVAVVTKVANDFLEADLISKSERNAIVRAAARSDCGKR